MTRNKKTVIMVTGKTKTQMIDEMKTMQFVGEQGIRSPKVKGYYAVKTVFSCQKKTMRQIICR